MIDPINVIVPDRESLVLDDSLGNDGILLLVDDKEQLLGVVKWDEFRGYHLLTCTNGRYLSPCKGSNPGPQNDTIENFMNRYKSNYKSNVKLKYIGTVE